jgi:hypothetical protein
LRASASSALPRSVRLTRTCRSSSGQRARRTRPAASRRLMSGVRVLLSRGVGARR